MLAINVQQGSWKYLPEIHINGDTEINAALSLRDEALICLSHFQPTDCPYTQEEASGFQEIRKVKNSRICSGRFTSGSMGGMIFSGIAAAAAGACSFAASYSLTGSTITSMIFGGSANFFGNLIIYLDERKRANADDQLQNLYGQIKNKYRCLSYHLLRRFYALDQQSEEQGRWLVIAEKIYKLSEGILGHFEEQLQDSGLEAKDILAPLVDICRHLSTGQALRDIDLGECLENLRSRQQIDNLHKQLNQLQGLSHLFSNFPLQRHVVNEGASVQEPVVHDL